MMAAPKTEWQEISVENGPATLTFEDIYRQFGGKILNLAYRMAGTEETARDLAQEVFIKVYENMEAFRGESQVYTWIYRIAANHILNHLKSVQRQRWLSLMDKPLGEVLKEEEIEPGFRERASTPGPDRHLEKSEREKIVWNAVQSLPPKYRIPFVLHRYEEMSYREITEVMELSLSAVEARIHRAKKMLIEKLEPLLEEL